MNGGVVGLAGETPDDADEVSEAPLAVYPGRATAHVQIRAIRHPVIAARGFIGEGKLRL